MDVFLSVIGATVFFFLMVGLPDIVDKITRSNTKIAEDNRKAAEANRDAKKYELEASRNMMYDK